MRILLAPDKFKGSLTASEVCKAMQEALLESIPNAVIESNPMADGGEGTCSLLTKYYHGRIIEVEVNDPLFRKIKSHYGISADGTTAWIEMANATGLSLLQQHERNPLETSSYGTGELIAHALNEGVNNIVLGIGGSATNDGGIGMAAALGFRFLDANGAALHPIGKNLLHVKSIETTHAHLRLQNVNVIALADVQNPLLGNNGAATVFAPQKGADAEAVKLLESGLTQYALVIQQQFNTDVNFAGAGAGGGMGSGAVFFLQARLTSGIAYLMQATNLENKLQHSDVIITGEGKMDVQTLSGKVIQGVTELASRYHKPVFAVVGKNDLTQEEQVPLSLKKVVALQQHGLSSAEAQKNAFLLIKQRLHEEIIPLLLSAPAD